MGFYSTGVTVLCCLVLFRLCEPLSPFSPDDNNAQYPINSLGSAGALFPLDGSIPSARVHHSIVATSDYVIVYGGYKTDGSLLGDTNLFYIPKQRWSGPILRRECCNNEGEDIETIGYKDAGANDEIDYPFIKAGFEGDFPLPRAEHSACAMGERMFIMGGVTEPHGYANDLYAFDPLRLRWRGPLGGRSSGSQLPQRRAGHSIVCEQAPSHFAAASSSSSAWEPESPVLVNAAGTGAAEETGGSIYLFGGRAQFGSRLNVGLSDVWRYDTQRRRWTRLSSGSGSSGGGGPSGRQHSAVQLQGGDLYVFGGADPASGLAFDDVWLFRTGLRSWQRLYPRSADSGSEFWFNYQFAPPPLHNAHLLPLPTTLDPVTALNYSATTTATHATADGQAVSDPSQLQFEGFLVYGGVGGGGVCGSGSGGSCSATERVLGQVYRFAVEEGSWASPHSVTGSLRDAQLSTASAEDSAWEYARLAAAATPQGQQGLAGGSAYVERRRLLQTDRGGLVKAFALEKAVFVSRRNLLYEFGGMRTSTTPATSHTSTGSSGSSQTEGEAAAAALTAAGGQFNSMARFLDPSLEGSAAAATPVLLDAAGGSLDKDTAQHSTGRDGWDAHTGEQLRSRLEAPTNGAWNYSQGFFSLHSAGGAVGPGAQLELTGRSPAKVEFLRAFRTYSVTERDIVLLREDVF